ncbi:unnamed protein product [Rhizophagus irregularis]|nr:unnamed protein product [Rhizophagus irregularis]
MFNSISIILCLQSASINTYSLSFFFNQIIDDLQCIVIKIYYSVEIKKFKICNTRTENSKLIPIMHVDQIF